MNEHNGEVFLIRLDGLVMNPQTQIRTKTHPRDIRQYAENMRAGVEFPPIKVAPVDHDDDSKGFILIDGWHRVQAAQLNGMDHIRAQVVTGADPKEYRWIAAKGNRTHGIRLTRADRREVFRAFVEAGEHRKGRGFKSAREMARDLQGIVSHVYVPVWMKQDFPGVFAAMNLDGTGDNPEQETGRPDMDPTHIQLASAALGQFLANLHAITSKEARKTVLMELARATKAATGKRTLPLVGPVGDVGDF